MIDGIDYLNVGQDFWMLVYNDNSDVGQARDYFAFESDARLAAGLLEEEGPQGNEEHPAPERLGLRLFYIKRLALKEDANKVEEAGG